MDRFSYAIMNDEKHLLALKSYLLNADLKASQQLHPALQDIFLEDKTLKLPFQKTKVGLINNKSTLVPNKLFQASELNTYLQNQISSVESDQVFVDEVPSVDAKNIYAFDQEVFYLIKGYLPKADFYHNYTSVLHSLVANAETDSATKLFVNVKGDHIQLTLLDGQDLIFSNSFPYQTEHDFIYHVMLAFDQFKLSVASVPVFVAGQITDDSKIYRILYRYINHVQYIDPPFSINFGKETSGIPSHFYYDLFSLEACGS